MNIDLFLAALMVLDSTPPTFSADLARHKAFLQIGEFFDNSVRAGAAFDLKTQPNPLLGSRSKPV